MFFVYNSGDNNLKTFKEILNNLNPDIKFTVEKSLDGISYLDILLNKQDEVIIITDLYIKKKTTDTISILHFNSSSTAYEKSHTL